MKRTVSLILAVVLCLIAAVPAFAATSEQIEAADRLYSLGLFKGAGVNDDGTPNYDLDRAPTRAEAVTMLVRLLGKEDEALSGNWTTPFIDVPEWARPYVGYAYAHDYTNGTSSTTFGSGSSTTATQFLTFVLRALGYTSGEDFAWDSAWTLTDFLGITDGEYPGAGTFTRGDAVLVSSHALDANLKGHAFTLLDSIQGATPVTYKVTRVIDGDTFVIDYNGTEKTIRLIGVDTPESVHPDSSKNTEAGIAAAEFTKARLTGARVEIELDVQDAGLRLCQRRDVQRDPAESRLRQHRHLSPKCQVCGPLYKDRPEQGPVPHPVSHAHSDPHADACTHTYPRTHPHPDSKAHAHTHALRSDARLLHREQKLQGVPPAHLLLRQENERVQQGDPLHQNRGHQ